MSDLYPHLRDRMDDVSVIRGCFGDVFDHAPAIYLRNSGSQFPGHPCSGSWVTYGLGTENQNLPAFVVMSDGSTKSGPPTYGAGFLPAVYQGTVFRSGQTPILYLRNPAGIPDASKRETLSFIGQLDRQHEATRPADSVLDARIASCELAYRMQSSAPDVVDFTKESDATRKLYGIGDPATDDSGGSACWGAGWWSAASASSRSTRAPMWVPIGMKPIQTWWGRTLAWRARPISPLPRCCGI